MIPQVAVIMSVFNGAPYLEEAVRSIQEQAFRDFEFLIVDDGSTDGSGVILDRLAARDRRIRILRQSNRGLIHSLNRAISESHAPILARMDADDVSEPERLERQMAFLASHPRFGLVGAQMAILDEDDSSSPAPWLFPTTPEGFMAALEDSPLICHPAVMMRRDVVADLGGYRTAFVCCEDYDLWLRMSERTLACSLPETLLRYRRHPHQVSTRDFVRQQINSGIAWEAYCERRANRQDPTAELTTLPSVDELDALFGRPGVAAAVRARVVSRLIYSPPALRGEGYEMVLDQARNGFSTELRLWRTVARLTRLGLYGRAIRLAAALALR